MWYWAVLTSGYSLAIAAKRSSQYGMLWMIPFDLVAEVTWRRGRFMRQLERVAHDAVAAPAA